MLNITEIRIKKINKGKLLAVASVCIDNCFIVKEIRLINGKYGRFLGMPNTLLKNKNFRRDYMYPNDEKTYNQLLGQISAQYEEESVIENKKED